MKTATTNNQAVYSSPEAFETTFSTLVTCLKTELSELNAVIHHCQSRVFAAKKPADKKAMLAVLQAYEAKKNAVMHQLTGISYANATTSLF